MQDDGEENRNRERIEKRTAYVTSQSNWMQEKEGWGGLRCIGALHMEFKAKGVKSSEWHYNIVSGELTAEGLLRHARMEWKQCVGC